jgi:hypothetical protein
MSCPKCGSKLWEVGPCPACAQRSQLRDNDGNAIRAKGKVSLSLALVGMVLLFSCAIADVLLVITSGATQGGTGPPEAKVGLGLVVLAACVVVCLICESIAFRFGLAAKSTRTGIFGLIVSSTVFLVVASLSVCRWLG